MKERPAKVRGLCNLEVFGPIMKKEVNWEFSYNLLPVRVSAQVLNFLASIKSGMNNVFWLTRTLLYLGISI